MRRLTLRTAAFPDITLTTSFCCLLLAVNGALNGVQWWLQGLSVAHWREVRVDYVSLPRSVFLAAVDFAETTTGGYDAAERRSTRRLSGSSALSKPK